MAPALPVPLLAGLLVLAVASGLLRPAGAQALPTGCRDVTGSTSGATGTWCWPAGDRSAVVRPALLPRRPWEPGHRGVDLGPLAPGDGVRAAAAGTVTFAGAVAGRPVLVVSHAGGLRTTYEPVRATAAVGSSVAAGDVVGVLDTGPTHCAPTACLHWGLRRGDLYLDPVALLAPRVRLLPLDGLRGTPGGVAFPPGPDRGPGSPATVAATAGRTTGAEAGADGCLAQVPRCA